MKLPIKRLVTLRHLLIDFNYESGERKYYITQTLNAVDEDIAEWQTLVSSRNAVKKHVVINNKRSKK